MKGIAQSGRWRRLLLGFSALLVMCVAQDARADVCSASIPTIAFGTISPVAGQDYVASGTLSVTCTFVILVGNVIVLPNINGCASLGASTDTSPRYLASAGRRIAVNLYRAPTYVAADLWGHYASALSISSTWAGVLAVGTNTQTYPVYAKIAAADLAGAAIDSDAGTVYSASYTGVLNYTSASSVVNPCQQSGATASYTVNVTAKIANDCKIDTTPVAFTASGVLRGTNRATGSVNVRCTMGNSYRIALNGGTVSNDPANRTMKNAATGELIRYNLSASYDGPLWGDGTAGTAMVANAGTGATQQLTVYGLVPQQVSPSPGDYSDRITATVYF